MKLLIAPDKFKGSLDSFSLCSVIANAVMKVLPGANCLQLPMADGGDGFSSVMQHYRATIPVTTATVDPLHRDIKATWQWDAQNKTAIIEVAAASGIALLKQDERNPLLASTYGTGLLIKAAIEKGAHKIVLGLGGSATNDAGTGILTALGFDFLDQDGRLLKANGQNLQQIKKVVPPEKVPPVHLEIASDVRNPMYGITGAAWIYARQKGADDNMIKLLDEGLKEFSNILTDASGVDRSGEEGMGAAGAIAAGLLSFFPGQIRSGIEMLMEASRIKDHIHGAQLLLTGEGKLDNQSGQGKVVGTLASLAKSNHIPCWAICGANEMDEDSLREAGISKVLAIREKGMSLKYAVDNASMLIEEAVIKALKEFR